MKCVTTAGLYTLGQRHIFLDVLKHLLRFVPHRNMSTSQAKRPVSLLGTMAFGGRADAEQSLEMVKTFLDGGHKQVDTAFMYMDGKSEAIIGGMNLPKTGRNTELAKRASVTRPTSSSTVNIPAPPETGGPETR